MAIYAIPRSASEAIVAALHLSGLERRSGLVPRAVRVDLGGDATPFLGRQVEKLGRAWRVTLPRVSWVLPSAIPGYKDSYSREVTVLVAEATGQLVRIEASAAIDDPDMRQLPVGAAAERQMRDGREEYLGLPKEEPGISFMGALDAILSGGIGSPFQAKAVHGVYVLHTKMGREPRRVWAVTLRGIEPIPPELPKGAELPPKWQLNHIRNVVDATTGQVLFATSVPQPS